MLVALRENLLKRAASRDRRPSPDIRFVKQQGRVAYRNLTGSGTSAPLLAALTKIRRCAEYQALLSDCWHPRDFARRRSPIPPARSVAPEQQLADPGAQRSQQSPMCVRPPVFFATSPSKGWRPRRIRGLPSGTYRPSGTLDRLCKLDMGQHCKWIVLIWIRCQWLPKEAEAARACAVGYSLSRIQ